MPQITILLSHLSPDFLQMISPIGPRAVRGSIPGGDLGPRGWRPEARKWGYPQMEVMENTIKNPQKNTSYKWMIVMGVPPIFGETMTHCTALCNTLLYNYILGCAIPLHCTDYQSHRLLAHSRCSSSKSVCTRTCVHLIMNTTLLSPHPTA